MQKLLVDYVCALLILPPPTGIVTIGVVSGDGIVYVMLVMGGLTLIWEWRLTGATSKSYDRIKLSLAPLLAHWFILLDIWAQSMNFFLKEQGTPGAFTRDPVPSKALCDVVQSAHPKTLSCSIVTSGRNDQADAEWVHSCDRISNAGFEDAQLNLRLVAWHEDNGIITNCLAKLPP